MVMFRSSLRSVRTLALASCVLTGSLFAACQSQPAWGQAAPAADSYTWDTIGAEFATLAVVNTQKGAKDQVIYGRTSFSANRPLIDSWYKTYLFPSMANAELLGEISEKREMLAKDLESTTDATLHQYLTDLAYEETTRRATGNYHPFVRYNAMLVIGLNLNQLESRLVGGVRYPAVRLPKSLDFILDELKKPDQIDAVRLAAMLGIERHVRLVRQRPQDQPIPDGRKAEIAAYMQTLLDEKAPPAGRSPAAHTWLRRKAADVLGGLGAVGDNRTVFASLVRIVGDAAEPISLRCTAAETLGNLVYTDVTGIDALATAQQLGALAAFACRTEEARAKDEQKALDEDPAFGPSGGLGMGGMMGGMSGMMSGMMGGMTGGRGGSSGRGSSSGSRESGPSGGMLSGGMPGMPGLSSGGYPGMGPSMNGPEATSETEETVDRLRRRLKLPLACVLTGIRGQDKSAPGTLGAIGQLATDEKQKAEITKLIAAVDAVVKATDETKGGLDGMLKEIRGKRNALEGLLPNVVQESAKPTADEALPGGSLPGGDAGPAKPSADAGPAKEAAKG
ncbi:MAG: hypothetical protein ACYC3X_15155 [Pirellulaceae bacterium]